MRTILVICVLTLVVGAVLIWNAVRLPTHYGAFSGCAKCRSRRPHRPAAGFSAQNRDHRRNGSAAMRNDGLLFLFSVGKEDAAGGIGSDRYECASKERPHGAR